MNLLDRFVKAMDGEWRVVRYELLDDKVKVIFESLLDPDLEWGTCPFNQEIMRLPKIGQVGRIGFLSNQAIEANDMGPQEKQP